MDALPCLLLKTLQESSWARQGAPSGAQSRSAYAWQHCLGCEVSVLESSGPYSLICTWKRIDVLWVSPPLSHFIFALSHFFSGCSPPPPVTSHWSWYDAEVVETPGLPLLPWAGAFLKKREGRTPVRSLDGESQQG